ncbi:MAG TPA: hypothetical protein VM791_13900 [Vicinamibacterales bacterium]|jgi:dihydrofolate reductase|nr:hypothetical protein [Vicinamibacterales bacterium]
MSRVRVHALTISLDRYGAGPKQDVDNPLGKRGSTLHQWFYPTRTFQQMFGKETGTTGVDDDYAARGFDNIGGWMMGRNIFTPQRGPWPDDSWRGWCGDNPPYHVPVFVLTSLGYTVSEHVPSDNATHVVFSKCPRKDL